MNNHTSLFRGDILLLRITIAATNEAGILVIINKKMNVKLLELKLIPY